MEMSKLGQSLREQRYSKAIKRYPVMKPNLTGEEIWKFLQAARMKA